MAEQVLKQLVKDVNSLRSEVREIKIAVNERDQFQHRQVRPEYIKKIKRIATQKGKTYNSPSQLEKDISQ